MENFFQKNWNRVCNNSNLNFPESLKRTKTYRHERLYASIFWSERVVVVVLVSLVFQLQISQKPKAWFVSSVSRSQTFRFISSYKNKKFPTIPWVGIPFGLNWYLLCYICYFKLYSMLLIFYNVESFIFSNSFFLETETTWLDLFI